jgi:biofilm PGA synthesis lipoprotein PgaB
MRARRTAVLLFLARGGLALAALAVLALPAVTYHFVRTDVRVAQRYAAPALPAIAPADAALYTAAAHAPGRSFAVLGYHDIATAREALASPGNSSTLTVSLVAFAAQLRMLTLAGYRPVSAAEVAASLRDGPALPRRAALITFSGGRARTWTHADAVLARYRFRATVFVDPTQIGRRGYLNWEELAAMVRTGRWSVGAAMPDAGATARVGSGDARTSALFAGGRRETTAHLREVLTGVRSEITGHGLPQPVLFCYPFQPGYPFNRVAARFADLVGLVNRYFVGGLLNTAPDRLATRSWTVRHLLPRTVIFGATTDELLFSRLQEAASREDGTA